MAHFICCWFPTLGLCMLLDHTKEITLLFTSDSLQGFLVFGQDPEFTEKKKAYNHFFIVYFFHIVLALKNWRNL